MNSPAPVGPVTHGPGASVRAVLRCVNAAVLKDDRATQFNLKGTRVTLGRGVGNDVQVKADGVSRNHTHLVLEQGAWHVEDLGSKNGTRVNSSIVKGRRALNDNDTITIGRAIYKYSIIGSAAPINQVRSIDLGGGMETIAVKPFDAGAHQTRGAAKPTARAPATRSASNADTGQRQRVRRQKEQRAAKLLWGLVVGLALVVVIGIGLAVNQF